MPKQEKKGGGSKKHGRELGLRARPSHVRYNARAKARGWDGKHRIHPRKSPLRDYREDNPWAKA